MISNLTIVTITFNNKEELSRTYKNLGWFRKLGGKHIIINGGSSVKGFVSDDCLLVQEKDRGIYDALNKGIDRVETKYFMLIHSGDTLICSPDALRSQIELIETRNLDILLNDCVINFGKFQRKINSRLWHPWMFYVGVQPPHPPIIYRRSSLRNYSYNDSIKVIADFQYLETVFKTGIKYEKGNYLLVEMSSGGKTSSGWKSYFNVNKEFIKLKGVLFGLLTAVIRPCIKIILSTF